MLADRAALGHPAWRTTRREESLGEEVTRELERRVVLSVLDRKWREHLYEMDYLQEGIGLRAMAQRDPLVEYQREGFLLFQAMTEAIKEESVGYLFQLEVETPASQATRRSRADRGPGGQRGRGDRGRGPGRPAPGDRGQGSGRRPAPRRAAVLRPVRGRRRRRRGARGAAPPPPSRPAPTRSRTPASTRPCPCGSGKKYKRCHGAKRGAATTA